MGPSCRRMLGTTPRRSRLLHMTMTMTPALHDEELKMPLKNLDMVRFGLHRVGLCSSVNFVVAIFTFTQWYHPASPMHGY
jgi:hypothetical protein